MKKNRKMSIKQHILLAIPLILIILFTFVYDNSTSNDRLVRVYDSIGDINNMKKYQELYDIWKKKRETIEF